MDELRLGILGGTFDPIHYAHLCLAEEAMDQLRLDRVLFIPSGSPPHKPGVHRNSAAIRLMMTVLATASHPCFEVSWIELERTGPSYTVDTLQDLGQKYGPSTQFFFIIGADAVLELHTWKAPERVLQLCRMAIARRPGFDLERLASHPLGALLQESVFFDGPWTNVSSTEIRARVARGRSIRYLTPEPVADFILKQRLYRVDGE